jgi:hypothetical protein
MSKVRKNLNDSTKTYHPNKTKRMLNGTEEKSLGYPKKNVNDAILSNRNYSLWFGDYNKVLDEKSVFFRNRKIAANLDLIAFPFYKYDPQRKKYGVSLMFEDDGTFYTYPYRDYANISSEMEQACPFLKINEMDSRCFKK